MFQLNFHLQSWLCCWSFSFGCDYLSQLNAGLALRAQQRLERNMGISRAKLRIAVDKASAIISSGDVAHRFFLTKRLRVPGRSDHPIRSVTAVLWMRLWRML